LSKFKNEKIIIEISEKGILVRSQKVEDIVPEFAKDKEGWIESQIAVKQLLVNKMEINAHKQGLLITFPKK
jgi:hypothetical protein